MPRVDKTDPTFSSNESVSPQGKTGKSNGRTYRVHPPSKRILTTIGAIATILTIVGMVGIISGATVFHHSARWIAEGIGIPSALGALVAFGHVYKNAKIPVEAPPPRMRESNDFHKDLSNYWYDNDEDDDDE